MTWLRCVLLSVSCVLLVLPAVAHAQSNDEEEARRQLDIARQQVDQGNFEQALSAADTALRLFPSLYQAMMFKALAYEGLGKLKRAERFALQQPMMLSPMTAHWTTSKIRCRASILSI